MTDVVVVGAGPAGSTAALTLARRGLDVLLLDRAAFPRDKTCGDGLPPRALAALARVELIDDVLAIAGRWNTFDIRAPNGRQLRSPLPPTPGMPDRLAVVPRFAFDDLVRRAAVDAGARYQERVQVQHVSTAGNGVTVSGDSPTGEVRVRARAAVIAVGAASGLLTRSGILAAPPPMLTAMRTYYRDLDGLDSLQFRFDGVPLPGYGWIFPTSATTANVGAGLLRPRRDGDAPSRWVFDRFLTSGPIQAMIGSATPFGPAKGYPLRTDFATAPIVAGRVLLVGEAAGLVSPLTGEGIDYALETGAIAADHLTAMASDNDFGADRFAAYAADLRHRYQRSFETTTRMRDLYLQPWLLNRIISVCQRRPSLRDWLVSMLLGTRDIRGALSPRFLARVAVGL